MSNGQETAGPVYDWLTNFGVELQENFGEHIKPVAGRAKVLQRYLRYVKRYYQIVVDPQIAPNQRIAVVGGTESNVATEHQVQNGTLVILPPPMLGTESYQSAMASLIEVARYYYESGQPTVSFGDSPDWLDTHRLDKARCLVVQLDEFREEKLKYDRLEYVLYGTGDELESSVALLLEQLGLEVTPQPKGANIDQKARHAALDLGFALEITGTRGTIKKESAKIGQAFQHIQDRAGTPEADDRLIIVANTQNHTSPASRRDAFSPLVVGLLSPNDVLLITTVQLYELWKAVVGGTITAEAAVRKLHDQSGLFAP